MVFWRWAAKIRNPPTLLDKLGVKDGQRVAVLGVTDANLLSTLPTRVPLTDLASRDPASLALDLQDAELDLLFVQVDDRADLALLPLAAQAIAQAGAVWVLHPKGRPDLKDTDVMAAGKLAGLIDTQVARISDRYSALRFVIPKASRRPAVQGRR